MERIYAEENGRPVYNNDLLLLQSEALEASKAAWKNRGAFVLSGCTVSGVGPYNISSGLVFMDNEIMRFDGATGVTLPRSIQRSTSLTEYREYKDAISRATRQLVKAAITPIVDAGKEYITFSASGGRTLADAFNTDFVRTVGTQTVNGNKTFNGNNTFTGGNTFTGAITNSNTINGTGSISLSNSIQATQFISTVSTGTSPFSVASTTMVPNLNANLLSGLTSASFARSSDFINAGTGLTGGGQLNTSRTISVANQGITTSLIADSAVTTNKIADNSVTTSKIVDNQITSSKITANAINTNHIQNDAITNAKLGTSSVTGGKIADGSISNSKIVDGSVTNGKIGDSAITTAKIANGQVTAAKLASDVIDLTRGSSSSSRNLVNFTDFQQLGSKTYGRTLWNLTRNSDRLRPYVKAQFQARRDDGGVDVIQCVLQRNPNPDTGGVWSTIHTRTYRLDDSAWTTVILDTIDTSATAGDNYYRVVVTNTIGGLCFLSDDISYLIFGVPHY